MLSSCLRILVTSECFCDRSVVMWLYSLALLDSATKRMGATETRFGFEGSRQDFVNRLMRGAPQGSVMQWEHTERAEEEIVGSLAEKYGQAYGSAGSGAAAVDQSSMLNFDTVSEKVIMQSSMTTSSRCSILDFVNKYIHK